MSTSIKSPVEFFTEWGEFMVSELFTIKSPAKRAISSYTEGNVPYVSSGCFNNGVVSYLAPKDDNDIEKGNCISVSPLDGTSFFQERDFLGRGGAGSAISLLYNPNLNKYNALFICVILKKQASRFGYNDAFTSNNLKSLKIKLPAIRTQEAEYPRGPKSLVPDWEGMKEYMSKLE